MELCEALAGPTITFSGVMIRPGRPGVSALLTTAALKKLTTAAVNDFLGPHRQRRHDLAQDSGHVRNVVRIGNQRANEIAEQTLDEVRSVMGTVY